MSETREALQFLPKFVDYAQDLRRKASQRVGIPLEEITFVGIHNRRTVKDDSRKNILKQLESIVNDS